MRNAVSSFYEDVENFSYITFSETKQLEIQKQREFFR